MKTNLVERLKGDSELFSELNEKLEAEHPFAKMADAGVSHRTMRAIIRPEELPEVGGQDRPYSEAIVRLFARPSVLVEQDTFTPPESRVWSTRLVNNKSKLEAAIRSVGRVELIGNPDYPWAGTGWAIAEDVVVTNRHVADLFGYQQDSVFRFRNSPDPTAGEMGSKIDFKEEYHQNDIREVKVEKILFINTPGGADAAFLRLEKNGTNPPPIPISTGDGTKDDFVAVIGYPAYDSRNPDAAIAKIFGDIFNVKRLAPGQVMALVDATTFTHDCSTLGGNSGSAVVDIESGGALGLYFGGSFKEANYAVRASVLRDLLARNVTVTTPGPVSPGGLGGPDTDTESKDVPKGAVHSPADLAGREGFKTAFLGDKSDWEVPLPKLTAKVVEEAAVLEAPADGRPDYLLDYTHFSVAMHAKRRMAIFTAVNIDGAQSKVIHRDRDKWFLDGRIPLSAQNGEELYTNNDLDRGHMVRRLDPVWGDQATQANEDTFHFTNSTPQHKDLNQKTWNDLEDYVLDNAGAQDLKVCVFTGPVLAATDPVYRTVRIPEQFWKVVTIVNSDTGKLSSTGYVLSQRDMITNLEFVYGQFRTYQTSLANLAKITGLDFGRLMDFDPLHGVEAVAAHRLLDRVEDIVL